MKIIIIKKFIVLSWQAAKIHLGGMGTYFPVGKGKNGTINMLSTIKFWQKGAVTFLYEKRLLVRKYIFYSFLSSSGNKRWIKEHCGVSLCYEDDYYIVNFWMERSERQKKNLAISHPLPVLLWAILCTPQHNKEWEVVNKLLTFS